MSTAEKGSAPARGGLVLLALILVAAVANLNLAVANVALPSIGEAFDSSQTTLNLIAVGYSLGLAASVLYLGAVGDRYGRKLMLLLGTTLAVPFSLLATYAPSDIVLFIARLGGGLSAGMAYPTTLALIAALWSGPPRTRSIALWSALGGAISALGPLLAGLMLEQFWWGSVFLLTLPLAVVALVLAARLVPAHINEATDPVDNVGGFLSVVLVAALILAINFAPLPDEGRLVLGLTTIALAAGIAFFLRERRAENPAVRPRHRRSPHLLGCGVRWDHRVRDVDGCHVHRSAVPAERTGIRHARGRGGDPAGGRVHGSHRSALG
jgi:DHA2 family multidrug resistance protein-like MFS transporter